MIKLIEDEVEAELIKKKFEEEFIIDKNTDKGQFTSLEINWLDWIESYEEGKNRAIDLFNQDYDDRLFFLGSSKDRIKGKPQLIHENVQRIPVIRKIFKVLKNKGEDDKYVTKYLFLDDPFDKRYDGKVIKILSFDFYLYRIIDNEKEFYIFSQKKLPNEYCEFEGMKIDLDDVSEISNNLKVKKISSIFLCKKAEPYVKTLKPEELVKFTNEQNITKERFHDILFCHPNGNVYDYSDDFNLLRKAQLLSSKYEGYPLHLIKIGPVGTGKTTEAEVLNFKFQDQQGILEAANSTLKVLVPSFKEKPANLGYIAKCNRIAIIDELMKMVEKERTHDAERISNYFGQMNMLLEQKDRMVGSGNDNSTRVKSTSKVCITTNNISGRNTIYEHLNVIDPTTLSRMVVWVQDYDEIEKIYRKDGIKEFPPHIVHPPEAFSGEQSMDCTNYNSPMSRSCHCVGEKELSNFLTIYDSCQQFLVNFDNLRCKKLFDVITNLIKEPMRQVWRARGLHHLILILDGLVKHRCLFIDYDPKFEIKDSDYDELERLLFHMVKTWEVNFNKDIWKEVLKC